MVAFLNAYSEGLSGGDACFLETAKRLSFKRKIVITSLLGRRLCETAGVEAEFVITSRESNFKTPLPIYAWRTLRAIGTHLKTTGDVICYSTSDFLPDVWPAYRLRASLPRARWVQKIFHLIPKSRWLPHMGQRVSHALVRRRADLAIVDNAGLAAELVDGGFAAERVRVVHPGIDENYFHHLPARKSGYDGVFLGRLHESKGVFDLVEIWSRVASRRPGSRLALVGNAPADLRRDLEAAFERQGMGRLVDILGHLPRDAAYTTLRGSSVFLFPSREEGFGMAALEAMACGVPAVSWDLPVFQEVFPRGLVRVPILDFDAFADAVISLMAPSARRARVSADGLQLAKEYDWAKVVAREDQFLRAL